MSNYELRDCDLRINTAGNQVVCLLFVSEVERVLDCSTSRAYEIIRELRGYPAGRGRAAVLPSVLQDYCARQFGGPVQLHALEYFAPLPPSMTPEEALRVECERLRSLPETPTEAAARERSAARRAGKDVPEPAPPEKRRRLPAGLQMTQPRTTRRKGR